MVIPAFNEQTSIGEVIERSTKGLSKAGLTGEIVIIDDGSTDSTRQVVIKVVAKNEAVRLLQHPRNLGLARALQTGIANSRGSMIIIIPADLESDPEEDIPKLLEEMTHADLVSGWRQGRRGPKIIASGFYNLLYRWLFKINVHDANWIKCFRRPVVSHFRWTKDWNRYLILYAARAGFRVKEVKVSYYKRAHGDSKFGIMRLPSGFVSFLKTYREISKKN